MFPVMIPIFTPSAHGTFYPWCKIERNKSSGKANADTDLTSAAANVNVFDFSYPSWDAYSRCGYTSAKIFT